MRVLIVTWDGGGNLPPALGIARELVRRGHEVRVVGHRSQGTAVAAAGLGLRSFDRGRDWVAETPKSMVGGVVGLAAVFSDRGIGDDAIDELAAFPAEVVLVDCLLFGAILRLREAGAPVVSLVHSAAGYFDALARGPLALLTRIRGVDAREASRAAALRLVTTRAEFEPPRWTNAEPGVEVVHTGFIRQDATVEARPTTRPTVLVSYSTMSLPGQSRSLQRAIDGLGRAPIDLVVTTGGEDPALLRVPAGVRLAHRIDHGELMPSLSLVVGHGGHATTARALSAGVPVLVLPMQPISDEPLIGRAVARLGLGRTASPRTSPSEIGRHVRELLADAALRERVRAYGAEVRAAPDGAIVGADALERFAAV